MANLVFNQLGSGYNATALMEFLQDYWGDTSVYSWASTEREWQGNVPDTLNAYSGSNSNINISTLQDYADNYDKFPYFKLADGQSFSCDTTISSPFMLFYGSSYGSDFVAVMVMGVSINGKVFLITEQSNYVTPFLSENFWTNFNSSINCTSDDTVK